jgi:hypothetical protein
MTSFSVLPFVVQYRQDHGQVALRCNWQIDYWSNVVRVHVSRWPTLVSVSAGRGCAATDLSRQEKVR